MFLIYNYRPTGYILCLTEFFIIIYKFKYSYMYNVVFNFHVCIW